MEVDEQSVGFQEAPAANQVLDEQSVIQDAPARRGHGGWRPGSGRKQGSRFGVVKGDREYARDLVSRVMRDEAQELELRVRCAGLVLSSVGRNYQFEAPAGPPADPAAGDLAVAGDDLAVPVELAGPVEACADPAGGNPTGPDPS